MNIPAAKRNMLIVVAVATLAAIGSIWFFLITAQQAKLKDLNSQFSGFEDKRRNIRSTLQTRPKVDAAFIAATEKLAEEEQSMASGDLYAWFYTTIKTFKANYHVDIPQFGTIETGNSTLIPNFPYKQVKSSVSGTAFFQDFGKFLADFENHFPYLRVENLTLEPIPGAATEAEREKLNFRMDIIAPVNNSGETDKK